MIATRVFRDHATGGWVATLADELAAWACIVNQEKFGFTVSLEARYQSPVRIGKRSKDVRASPNHRGAFLHVDVKLTQEARQCFASEFRFVAARQERAWTS
jgi:acyl-coenzyme A thioesterase PaaI-like protein